MNWSQTFSVSFEEPQLTRYTFVIRFHLIPFIVSILLAKNTLQIWMIMKCVSLLGATCLKHIYFNLKFMLKRHPQIIQIIKYFISYLVLGKQTEWMNAMCGKSKKRAIVNLTKHQLLTTVQIENISKMSYGFLLRGQWFLSFFYHMFWLEIRVQSAHILIAKWPHTNLTKKTNHRNEFKYRKKNTKHRHELIFIMKRFARIFLNSKFAEYPNQIKRFKEKVAIHTLQ